MKAFRVLLAILVSAIASNGMAGELAWSPADLIAETWQDKSTGAFVEIEPSGEFVLHGKTGDVRLTGRIEVAAWEYVDDFPGSLFHAVILKITAGEKDALVAGCYILGEGDPCGLELLASTLPKEFREVFDIEWEEKSLWLTGPGPHE